MEGEIYNFILVWTSAVITLCYCYTVGKFIPKGFKRFLAILPAITLFLLLPLKFTSIHLGGPTSFFIAWLANFKLLLFAFSQNDPLSSLPLSKFIPIAILPIKFRNQNEIQNHPSSEISKKSQIKKSPVNYAGKALFLGLFLILYEKKESLNHNFLLVLYTFHVYFFLEIALAGVGALSESLIGIELEPTFDEPVMSTSLQDFWGRRWNLMVTKVLQPTVYQPVRAITGDLVGKKMSSLLAVLMTFFVSGIMHELIFYYMGRKRPTWDVTCFFLLHGICLVIEIEVKKWMRGKWEVSPVVSVPATVGFLMFTSVWMFLPALLRCEVDVKARREVLHLLKFVKNYGKK